MIVKEALKKLRAHYSEHKDAMPSQQRIADMTGLSESTIQRVLSGQTDNIKYATIMQIAPAIGLSTSDLGINKESIEALNNEDLQALVLALREINMRELSAQREVDDARWRERLDSDQKKYQQRIELLTTQHAEEMHRMTSAHADEMKRCRDRHDEHVSQIHSMYDRQMESMRSANAKQIELMLDGHRTQLESMQKIDSAQQETVLSIYNTQKNADEKSKEYLKGRIEQLDKRSKTKDKIIFALIFCITLLFVADFFLPSMGWIRRLTSTMFSYHYFG